MTEEIIAKILRSEELPTLPIVASKLITLTSREDATLTDIAALISKDIALSSKILKVSNSAFYSFPQKISSIHQAVSILGTNAVRSLVLSFSFLSINSGKKKTQFNFKEFWEESLAMAVAAKTITEKLKDASVEDVFISGLLQNLGKLIFARTFPEEFDKVLTQTYRKQIDPSPLEEEIIGANHSVIGYEIAKYWGFPESLLLPILYHHNPEEYKGDDTKVRQIINAVYLADIIAHILYAEEPEKAHRRFQQEAKRLLNLRKEDIDEILQDVHMQVEQAGEYFGLKMKNTRPIQEILQEANIRLSVINLNYDQMNKQLILAKIELENLARELAEKNRILDNLANIDGLTSVYNHRYFQNTLDKEIARAERRDADIALIIADIDKFKIFNDTYGHLSGDYVLKQFSDILKNNLRKYDTLARYGGEEFAIILPETDAEGALKVAEKLRTTIDETTFDDGSNEYHVTASFGIVCSTPSQEEGFCKNEMINKADQALYESKKNGRNRSTIFSEKKKWYKF